MISIINELQNKYLNFKLGEEQIQALLSIFSFIVDKDSKYCTLSGAAGTGKTSLTKIIVEYLALMKIEYVLAAPTHKAKNVLYKNTGRDTITIHQLLTLKPTIDILELDFKDIMFSSTSNTTSIPKNGVLLIDECSMVNNELFDYIVQKCSEQNCKIIGVGDIAQLIPVKQNYISKIFNIDNVISLTKIYRQKGDNPLLDVLYELRLSPKIDFQNIKSDKGSLLLYNHWNKFIDDNIHKFEYAINRRELEHVKLLAYTNKRVEAFNNVIRDKIFHNECEYNIGDILMAYDSCEFRARKYQEEKIINSCDYFVMDVENTIFDFMGAKALKLYLFSYDEGYELEVLILSRDNPDYIFNGISKHLEMLRLNAIKCTTPKFKKKLWVDYFNFNNSFLTPIDLVFDNRVVRKKSLDYGYTMTVHKSQSSSYNNILIDMNNILLCQRPIELRQLQYVGMSRTRKDIDMLIK